MMDDHIHSHYETDFLCWLNSQVKLLRAKRFKQLDLENLIEEVEDMARQFKQELRHRVELLLVHLLKYKYQPDHASGSWRGTIGEQRMRIKQLLEDAPSLAPKLEEEIADRYAAALARATKETGLPEANFPTSNPFTKA